MGREPVLVATDLSARADRAVDRALALGAQLARPVVAVHVLPADAEEENGAAERRVRAVLPDGAEASIAIARGSADEAIAATAEAHDAALICVGVARYNSLGDYLLGNAVDYISRQSDRPLLVVKNRAGGDYRTIVFPTDFSDCSRQALAAALRLFPQARFCLLHVWHVPYAAWNKDAHVGADLERDAAAAMDRFLGPFSSDPQAAGRIEGATRRGDLFGAIHAVAEERGATLVAFGTHGESGPRHATIGSTANEMLNTLQVDSLIIRGG